MSGPVHAVLYSGKGSFVVVDRESGELGPDQVEVAPAFTGICGTDLHIFHGDMDARVAAPQVIGHEMSGRISRLGENVQEWEVGHPVTVMPLAWDGTCPSCRAGHVHLCHNLDFIGIDSPGAMQSRWIVPADTLVRLPDSLPLDVAALVEPTAVAVHDVRRAEARAGEKVVIVGSGPVGLLIAVVARSAGCEVRVVELDPYRRSVAADLGLAVLDPKAVDVTEEINWWTDGAGADVAFEVSGAAAGVSTAVDSLRTRGRLCLVAIHPRPREVNLHRFFWRELTLIGARLYERSDFDEAVRLIACGELPARALITRVEPLAQALRAFEALEAGGEVMKILVDCQSGEKEVSTDV